jgi:3-oxoacyl-[acyl-carrier-protein] synthase-1
MRAYINNYELQCNAGNVSELMDAIYKKESALVESSDYIEGSTAGLGIMKYANIYEVLDQVVAKVLKASNLETFENTLLILGSSVGGMQACETLFYRDKNYKNINPNKYSMNALTDYLARKYKFYDTRAISTACTSSANALLLAKRLLHVEAYENILVVGADGICNSTVQGFHALGVLSSKKCKPFDVNRDGMNVAEAVAALLLQGTKTEKSIELKGVGASSDAYHMTNPNPEGIGAVESMNRALKDAKLEPCAIDYINAHGTATLANDRVEALAIEKIFGTMAMVNSTKAITGHTLGAAGAIEAIISCEVIKQGKIPPQTNLEEQENQNITLLQEAKIQKISNVLSNSFAFGGNNTSLILGALK